MATVRILGTLALSVTVILGTAAHADESPLTLAEAQRLAIVRSKQIEASGLAVAASREQAVAAAERPDPVAKFGVQNVPVNGAERFSLQRDFMTMRTVGIMQEITRPAKLRARADRAERAVQLTEAEEAQATAAVERDTALAWLDRYYAQAMEQTVLQQEQAAQLEVTASEAAYRGGQGTSADVLAARGVLAQLQDLDADAARQVRGSKIALARWIGAAAEWNLAGRPQIDTIPLHNHNLDSQLADHPEILALRRREELARADVEVARAARHPDWSVELMYGQRGAGYSNMVTLEFSVPLEIDRQHRQDRVLAAQLAEASKAKAEREDMLRQHVAEIGSMIEEWNTARERRDRYRDTVIPLALDRTTATRAAYRGGKATLSDLLLARRDEIDTRLKALEIEAGAARLWAQLTFINLNPAAADATTSNVPLDTNRGDLP